MSCATSAICEACSLACTSDLRQAAGWSFPSRSCCRTRTARSAAAADGLCSRRVATRIPWITSKGRQSRRDSPSEPWNDRRCATRPMRQSPGCLPCWSERHVTAEAALDLLHRGDPAGALALLADEPSPDEPDSALLAARGMVQLANDNPAAALTDLRKAAALGNTAPTTLLNLALAEQKAGDSTHALRLMADLERHMPGW